jgi:hypothetical protein
MGVLSRDAILACNDRKSVAVEIPEWGGTVYVRVMSGADRDQFDALVTKDGVTRSEITSLLARLCIADEAGAPLFRDEDIAVLAQKSAAVLDRIFDVATKLNATSGEAIDEMGKDSAGTASGATPSSSPSDSTNPTSTDSSPA